MSEAASDRSDNVVKMRNWQSRFDQWMNLATGLGMRGRDKSRHDIFTAPREFYQSEIDNLARGDALAARIVGNRGSDMIRAWWELKISPSLGDGAEDLDPAEVNRVSAYIQKRVRKLQGKRKLRKALRWDDQYGGSLVMMIVDDGQEMSEPLKLESVKKIKQLHVLHRYQVTEGPTETDPDQDAFGLPSFYRLTSGVGSEFGDVVHASRMLRFQAVDLSPDIRRRTSDSFGDSIFVRCWEALSDFQMAYRAVAALMADFAQGVWKIPHLKQMADAKMHDVIQQRIGVQDFVKGVTNAIMVDPEVGEDYTRIATPVGGLADLLDRLSIRLGASTGQPLTKIMSVAPKGFATEDKSGDANWDDTISSAQEDELHPEIVKLVTVLLHEEGSPNKGVEPESWDIEFSPLTQPTALEKAQLEKVVAERDAVYIDFGVARPSEVRSSRFTSDGFSMETNLDSEISEQIENDDKKPKPGPPPMPPPFGAPPPPEEGEEQGEEPEDDDEQEE